MRSKKTDNKMEEIPDKKLSKERGKAPLEGA
jgi:hypothetical protein